MTDKLKEYAKRGRDDLYWLCRNVLGYTKVQPKPHKDLVKFMDESKKRTKLILMPRGSFKSSVITVAYTIQQMIRNPNIRILVSSETQNKSIKFVSEIKAHIEGNEKFKALYGDWVNKGNIWKGNEFIIKPRTIPKKEPTIMAGSLERQSLTGLHFDYCVLDDVVSQANTNNEHQIEKTIDHYKLLLSVLDPGGTITTIGTVWGAYSLYSFLTDPEGPEHENTDYFHRAAEDNHGKLLMPKILSREFLDQQKKTQGSYIYSCQYLNKADYTQFSFFKEEDIQVYDKPPGGLIYFMACDPAISLRASSDFTAILVVGLDFYGNWYIVECIEDKMEPSELIAKLLELNRKYPAQCLAMENFALEKVLKIALDEEMLRTGEFIPIRSLKTNTRISKEARIKSLQPILEQKKIFVKKEHKSLVRQIVQFPHLKFDDLIDCLKNFVGVVYPSDQKPEAKPGKSLNKVSMQAWEELRTFKRRRVKSSYEEL
jgi:predicted phage terminase large subunit-like protein